MKRKYIDHSKWKKIKKSKSILFNTYQERFNGYASAIFIEKVHEKLVCNFDKKQFCVLDNGYILIQRLPIEKNWSVTTIFDENNNIIDQYFDITKQNGIDIHGQPFYDDLYLDVVVFPSGEIALFDEDELNKALENGDITQMDFDLAYNVANQIINGMGKDVLSLWNMSYNDLEYFSTRLGIKHY